MDCNFVRYFQIAVCEVIPVYFLMFPYIPWIIKVFDLCLSDKTKWISFFKFFIYFIVNEILTSSYIFESHCISFSVRKISFYVFQDLFFFSFRFYLCYVLPSRCFICVVYYIIFSLMASDFIVILYKVFSSWIIRTILPVSPF